MTGELRCRETTGDGSPCRAPASLVNPETRYCPSHDPRHRERLREAGRKGGEAMARRFKRKGLDEDELPPLNSPEAAELWLECIGLALSKGVVSPDNAIELRATLPELRSGSDEFTENFCALVEEKHAEHVSQRQRKAAA